MLSEECFPLYLIRKHREGWNCRFSKDTPAREEGTRSRQCRPKVPGWFAFPGARSPRICSILRFGFGKIAGTEFSSGTPEQTPETATAFSNFLNLATSKSPLSFRYTSMGLVSRVVDLVKGCETKANSQPLPCPFPNSFFLAPSLPVPNPLLSGPFPTRAQPPSFWPLPYPCPTPFFAARPNEISCGRFSCTLKDNNRRKYSPNFATSFAHVGQQLHLNFALGAFATNFFRQR